MKPTTLLRLARRASGAAALCLLAGLGATLRAAELPAASLAFLDQHCLNCHDAETKKGGLDLEALALAPTDKANFEQWVRVHDKAHAGEMPPKNKARPAAPELADFLATLAAPLAAADSARQAERGRGVVRRLNRVEFETAVSDLLAVPLRLRELLPPDAKGAGFDTVGAALNVSSVQMESYLAALDVALDGATHLIERPPVKKWRLSYLNSTNMMQVFRGSGAFTPLADGVAMFSTEYFFHLHSLMDHFAIPHSGRYRVRVSARALRSPEPLTMTVRMAGGGNRENAEVPRTLLGHVSVREGEAQVFAFEDYLERGQMLRAYPSSLRPIRFQGKGIEAQRDYRGPALVVQWIEVEGPLHESWPPPSHERLWAGVLTEPIAGVKPNEDPNAQLDRPPVEIAKPRLTKGPKDPVTGNQNYYDPKQGAGGEPIYRPANIRAPLHPTLRLAPSQPKQDAARLLAAFVPAAFRRPVDAAEIEPFVDLAERWLAAGVDFESALRTAYKAVLTAPGFLYHRGGRPFAPAQPRLDGHELAERLAFFLWSGLPDAALLHHTAAGTLHDPAELRRQVARMLRDPKSERFLESFLGQWLDLRLIDFTAPDSDLYPEFDPLLQWSMVAETTAFFRELLTHDLSVRNIVHSDFAMLNRRLARHYGLPGVDAAVPRRTPLPADSVRGGVLTHASILKVTANGSNTSPVVRGAWVLDRIMGRPASPPPPGVPAVEPDIRGATTLRQMLAQHRDAPSCMVCHQNIDPPGVALESFDVIGGWRENYRKLGAGPSGERVVHRPEAPPPIRYQTGLPVDSADELADGRRFADVREFKQLLLADPDQIARTVAGKLITYATGAPATFADRAEIERILAATRPGDHGFRSLIEAVVLSPIFSTQ